MVISPSCIQNSQIKKAAYPVNKAAFSKHLKLKDYNQKTKPLPPYGKNLFNHLQKGMKPRNSIFLFLGLTAWRAAKAYAKHQAVLVLPPDQSPYAYYWPVQNCSVLIMDKGGVELTYIEQTAHALLLADALSVHALLFNRQLVIYRRA